MQILVGTIAGLGRVSDNGDFEWLLKGDVSAVDGNWAVVDGKGVAAIDNPRQALLTPLPARCVATAPWGLLVGTAEARLFEVGPDASTVNPVGSFDRVPTRESWYTPSGAPPDTRSVTVTDDGTPLANVHVGGVWRGEDGGTWREVVKVAADTHQVFAARDGSATVVAAAAVGFLQSDNGGRTFDWSTDGLHATYCRAVAIADDVVLVTASTGPFTQYGAVYVRPLHGGGPFTRCDNGLPEWFEYNVDTFQIAARGSDVVIGTDDGQVFASNDAGTSWDVVMTGAGRIRCVALV